MQTDVRRATVPQLIAEAERMGVLIDAQLSGLSAAQLSWKPNPKEWSLGQCIDHINVANSLYFGQLEGLLSGQRHPTFWERLPVLPALWGWSLIVTLDPTRQLKVKTAPVFEPTVSDVDPQILSAFVRQQARLVELMRACSGLDARRIIITSPAATFVTYSLLDAFRIIVVHEQHHYGQTSRLLTMPGFPAIVPAR